MYEYISTIVFSRLFVGRGYKHSHEINAGQSKSLCNPKKKWQRIPLLNGGGSSQGLPSHLQEDSEHLSQVSEVPQGDFSLSWFLSHDEMCD